MIDALRDTRLTVFVDRECSYECNTSFAQKQRGKCSLSDDDIARIAEFVRWYRLTHLHFAGCDSTIGLNGIRKVRATLPREVTYSVEVSGGLKNPSDEFWEAVGCKCLDIVYDPRHETASCVDDIIETCEFALARGIEVRVNVTLDSHSDKGKLVPFLERGLSLTVTWRTAPGPNYEKVGPQSQLPNEVSKSGGICGYVEESREHVFFYPGKGFTPCGGKLAVDEKADPRFVFSVDPEEYLENPLRLQVEKRISFQEIAAQLSISMAHLKPQTPCDCCSALNADRYFCDTLPSLRGISEIASRKGQGSQAIDLSEKLPELVAEAFKPYFKLRYGFQGCVDAFPEVLPVELPNGFSERDLSEFSSDELMHLYEFRLANLESGDFSETEIRGYRRAQKRAFDGELGAISGKIIFEGDEVVAFLMGFYEEGVQAPGVTSIYVCDPGTYPGTRNSAIDEYSFCCLMSSLREWTKSTNGIFSILLEESDVSEWRVLERLGAKISCLYFQGRF